MRSIVCDERYERYCFFCGTPTTNGVHHLLFGNSHRRLADEDGLFVPICDNCHTLGKNRIHGNPMAEKLSKMLGQAFFEMREIEKGECTSTDARERFRKRYGRSYF